MTIVIDNCEMCGITWIILHGYIFSLIAVQCPLIKKVRDSETMVSIQKPKSANRIYLAFKIRDDGNKKGGSRLCIKDGFFRIKINSAADWAHNPVNHLSEQ
jgi:hypothetical protein